MAAPTVTCYPFTGTGCAKGASQTQVDYGNVLAGEESDPKGMVFTPVSNSISSAKFWLQAGFADTDLGHKHKIQTACEDVGSMGTSGFTATPTAEVSGTTVRDSAGSATVADGVDSERIYTFVAVGAGAADGQHTCNQRLSYQYP